MRRAAPVMVLFWVLASAAMAAGKNAETSTAPPWPRAPEAPKEAPNIVLVLLDDVGFAAAGTFGGPAETPVLDTLASQGLRYDHRLR